MEANHTLSENFAVLLLAAIVCVSVSATRSCLKFCNITFQQTSATAPAAYTTHRVSTRFIKREAVDAAYKMQNEINAFECHVEKVNNNFHMHTRRAFERS